MDDPGQPVGYMERTRLYYRALGYKADYQWAHNETAPFSPLAKPLTEARIALLTTASPLDGSNKDAKGWRHVWSAPVDPAPDALDALDALTVGIEKKKVSWVLDADIRGFFRRHRPRMAD